MGLRQKEKKPIRTKIFDLDVANTFPKLEITNGEKWFWGWISSPDQFYKISWTDLHSTDFFFLFWRLESWCFCSASGKAALECLLELMPQASVTSLQPCSPVSMGLQWAFLSAQGLTLVSVPKQADVFLCSASFHS